MRQPPVPGWTEARITRSVNIPSVSGKEIAETVKVTVDAWKNADGEIFLDAKAREKIEAVKARHMGLLSPEQIKELRISLGMSQKQISELLQLGDKTWTRWETGKERPSRSMNLFLKAICSKKVGIQFLREIKC